MALTSQKIGIFAGSFDPIHAGHIVAAQAAAARAGLGKVYIIVEPRPRYKQGVKAHEHRVEMVRRAIAEMPLFGQIVLNEPYCTTSDTIPMLQSRFGEGAQLFMILGDDVAKRLAEWSDVDALSRAVHFLIIERRESAEQIRHIASSIKRVKNIAIRYTYVDGPISNFESSRLRKELKTGGYEDGLHPLVLSYIKLHNIYGSSGLGS